MTIGEQLFGRNHEMSEEDKTKAAQEVYDSVLHSFPALKGFMEYTQNCAREKGYTETVLGRRRHIPDMQLKPFEFKAMPGYVNPDVDPLDPSTLKNSSEIPERIVADLEKEFASLKYYGQVVKKTKELREQKIRVINNKKKIRDATRQCVNCVDFETEILTTSGWKKYNEVAVGDTILSLSIDSGKIEQDVVKDIHIFDEETNAVRFKSGTFDACSTDDHRWVVESHHRMRFTSTKKLYEPEYPDPIVRIADNEIKGTCDLSDAELRVLGWLMTDGYYYPSGEPHHMHIYQDVKRCKGMQVYEKMLESLKEASLEYTDSVKNDTYHSIYIKKSDFTEYVRSTFIDRVLTFDFVSTLSQRQAKILLESMMLGDGTGFESTGSFACSTERKCDVFQYLCVVAGYASNSYVRDMVGRRCTGNVANESGYVDVKHPHWNVSVLKVTHANLCSAEKTLCKVPGVWCVTTNNHTWIARRNGKVYVTGNSVIQGSAADLTKMAILNLEYNDRWHQIGGRLLVPVHDELICEVPVDFYEEGRDILKESMESAGDFMPFPITCDVETTMRWYGLEYPCPFDKPKSFSVASLKSLTESEISWVQYHLTEAEYILPKFPDKDGNPPIGMATRGINGIVSEELVSCVNDYLDRYKINEESFVYHIETLVQKGVNTK